MAENPSSSNPPQPLIPPPHSNVAKSLMGLSVPHNTKRSNLNSLNAFATFCISNYRAHRKFLLRRQEMSQALLETRSFLFPTREEDHLPSQYADWTEAQMIHVRYYMIEFAANYKNARTGDNIAASTLKTYIISVQRAFKSEWGYDLKPLSGPIFNCPKEGLLAVFDNKVRDQQRCGNHVVSHNMLSREGLRRLYSSQSLSKETPKGFQTRLFFTLGILTAMRPSALACMTVTQLRKTRLREQTVWMIKGVVGSLMGSSKTARGGWSAIGNKLQEIPVFNEAYEGGSINFYEYIDEYMSIRSKLEVGTDRLSLAINHNATHRESFFKRQHLGKNAFMSIVRSACQKEGVEGEGQKSWVTTHGLRGTLATLLFQNGHSDSSVALRTGHRDPKSLKSYQNLQGKEGLRQQLDLFGMDGSDAKRLKVVKCMESDADYGKENVSPVQRRADGTDGSRSPFTSIGNVTGGTVNVTLNCYVDPKKE